MNELEKLYKALTEKGYYTKSFEEFQEQYSDDSYKKKVYDVVSKDQLYTKDYDSFINKYSSEVKKKEESIGQTEPMVSEPKVDSSDTSQEDRESFSYKSYLKDILGGAYSLATFSPAKFAAKSLADLDYKNVYETGVAQGAGAREILSAVYLGKDIGSEEAKQFAEAANRLESIGPSDSMIQFDKDYEEAKENYGGALASIAALGKNPEVAMETVLTSMIAAGRMGPEAIPELIGTTLVGAEAGLAIGGPAGIIPGAAGGLRFGVGAILDGTMSMIEFTREELGEKPFTPENIQELFQDEERFKKVRNRALARGLTIGTIEAFAGAAAGKIAKPIAKVGIEAAGGGIGEVGARVAAGQEMDARETILEIVGGLAGAPATLIEGSYKINKQPTTAQQTEQIINEVDAKDLRDIDITIENDDNLSAKYNEKIQKQKIAEDIDPDVPEANREEIINLEYQRKQLESKNTVSAKEKVKQIDEKIKKLSKPTEEVVEEEVVGAKPEYNIEKIVEEKDGITTTKFNKYKNGRKLTLGEEKASVLDEMGYEIVDTENILEDLEVIGVSEIRESESASSVTISVRNKETGLIDRGFNFPIKKKFPSKQRVDNIVDDIIAKTEARLTKDVDPAKKLKNVKSYLQGSKFYQESTDIEREAAVRELNEKLGIKIKRPPSVKKILGAPKVEKVSVDPRVLLKERMGELQRATKQAAKFTKEELSSYQTQIKDLIKEVGKKGRLSKAQTIAITNRVLKPSFTDKSIANTLDYIDRIYENAELAERILSLNKMQKTAKKNAPKKLGAAIDVIAPLQKVLQIKPSNIPLDIIDDYESILNQVGQRKAVLDLEGKADLIGRINNVLENYEAEVSRPIEQESKEAEAFDADEAVSQIDTKDIDESNFQIRDERDHVRKFKSYDSNDFKMLPESLIKKLPAVISNISNGFVTKDVTEIINTIEAKKSEQDVHDVASKTYKRSDIRLAFSRMYGKLNAALSKNKSAILSEISNNPTFVIDDIFGNIGGKEIYNATFGKLAKSYATYEADLRSVKANYFDKAEKILQKGKVISVRNRNDVYKSKVKIMTYMLEREYKSNPGSNKVASALDFINATIEEINKPKSPLQLQYNIPVLEEIKNNFTVDGAIDEKKLLNSMTNQEKQALSLITEGNKSLREKAIFTSGVIRGSMPEIINDYIHHDVLITERSKVGDYLSEAQEVFLNPSTKAGTLLERQPGAKPISFDPISSSNVGARKTLLDYHLTSPLSQVRKSISGLNKIEGISKDLAQAYNALEVSMNDVLEKVFLNNFQETTFLEEALGAIKTIGYRAALASVPRAIGETGSNLTYIASVGAKPFSVGVSKYSNYIIGNPQEAIDIMKNLKSEQQSRLYDPSRIAAKDANTGVFTREKIGSGRAMSDLRNKISYIVDNTYVPTSDFVGKVQDGVIETPDKALSRPLWFGNFDRQFTKLTGKSPDMQKIQANDETYMSENKENLDKATKFADEESTRAAASVNPFNTIPKNLPSPKDIGTLRGVIKQANAYMTRFLIYEYTTARTAAISAFMGGKMPRAKAFATLGGVTMRMASYMILTSYLKDIMLSMFGYEEEEKDLQEMFTRQTIGSLASLALRRTVGNIPAIPINLAIEYVNEEYLEGLRSGEKYDPYEHGLVFSQVKLEDLQRKSITDLGVDVASGPYGSMVRSFDRFTKVATGISKSKRASTKKRYQEELQNRMVIEALGNLNLLPFYKDFRTLAIKRQFEDLEKRKNK